MTPEQIQEILDLCPEIDYHEYKWFHRPTRCQIPVQMAKSLAYARREIGNLHIQVTQKLFEINELEADKTSLIATQSCFSDNMKLSVAKRVNLRDNYDQLRAFIRQLMQPEYGEDVQKSAKEALEKTEVENKTTYMLRYKGHKGAEREQFVENLSGAFACKEHLEREFPGSKVKIYELKEIPEAAHV